MEDMNGKFGGVGLKISDHNGRPTVISPIDGTPAHGRAYSRATRSSQSMAKARMAQI